VSWFLFDLPFLRAVQSIFNALVVGGLIVAFGALVLRLPLLAADPKWCRTTATDARVPGAYVIPIRTPPGAASALGEVLDRSSLPDIAGTIAGDNTILVVPSEGSTSRSVERVLSGLMEG